MKLKIFAAAGIVSMVLSGAFINIATAQDRAVVLIRDNYFSPNIVTIHVGDAVAWTNMGQMLHTVTGDGGLFDSGQLTPGASFSRTFLSAGTFAYHCRYYGGTQGFGMSGLVVVTEPAGSVSYTVPTVNYYTPVVQPVVYTAPAYTTVPEQTYTVPTYVAPTYVTPTTYTAPTYTIPSYTPQYDSSVSTVYYTEPVAIQPAYAYQAPTYGYQPPTYSYYQTPTNYTYQPVSYTQYGYSQPAYSYSNYPTTYTNYDSNNLNYQVQPTYYNGAYSNPTTYTYTNPVPAYPYQYGY